MHMADSLHSPHAVGPRRVLSIHILIAVPPFGDLSVRERVISFPLSFLSFFFWQESTEELFLSAVIGAFQPAWIQLPVGPHSKPLTHHSKSESLGSLKARAPQGRSHYCVSTLCSLLSSDL